jgi:environmental stress-induced protein Ves
VTSVLRAAELPVSRWPNGAGRKADLLTGDGWMIGFAWLDADAPFSMLPEMDRTITLVQGPGFTLDVSGKTLAVQRGFEPTRFDGGATTTCRITGPSRVLNVMTARGRFRHTVEIVERLGPIASGGVARIAVVLDGAAICARVPLGYLDAVHVDEATALELANGSLIAVITIDPA